LTHLFSADDTYMHVSYWVYKLT